MTTRTRVGKRGTVVIPAALRRRYRMDEGAAVLIEEQAGGLFLKAVPITPSAEERRRFFAKLAEQVGATRADAAAWAEETAEREELAGTLLDGLEEHGGFLDA
jgi:bifunctional DNA-binding transcriptional regulator/antitoxin component of YhaV-PrlF toxin-antitoxin module